MTAKVTLGEVATIERSGVNPKELDPQTRYLGLEHIERGGRIIGHATVGEAGLASTKFRFTTDHVLFGKLRPNLGKVARADFDGVSSTDILPIRPGPRLDRDYLTQYLRQPSVVEFAATRTTGANLPRLSPTALAAFEIPLPPINEQRRIAAILDQADAVRAKRRQILGHLDKLTQSTFNAMFGDPVANPMGWPDSQLDSVVNGMQYGPRFYNEAYTPDGIRIVRITDLDAAGRLDYSAMPRMDVTDADRKKHELAPGDIIFARTGATVGKLALIGEEDPPSIAGAYFIRMRFSDRVMPEYAAQLLRSGSIQAIVFAGSHQSAQQNFSGPGLRALPFPVPPVELQRDFAVRIAAINAQRAVVERALGADDELFASLQSRAFRGEL